jgi:toxin YoeB
MINITFTNKAWGEYCYWQVQDKKTLKKINMILADIQRNNFVGVGKPEPLKNNFAGYWSRRIDSSNRLIYRINNNQIEVIQCKGHYE